MKDLALTLSRKINDADYEGWGEQIDVFAHNLQNHAYHTKLNATKPSTASSYQPASLNNTSAPALQNNLIDLNAI